MLLYNTNRASFAGLARPGKEDKTAEEGTGLVQAADVVEAAASPTRRPGNGFAGLV
jgi:hypothetical protein